MDSQFSLNSTSPVHSIKPTATAAQFAFSAGFIVLAGVGNVLICIAYYKFESLRTPSNSLVLSMAVCDLLLILVPIQRLVGISSVNEVRGNMCVASSVWGVIITILIMLHLCAISIDKLLAIKYSLRYPSLVTQRRVSLVLFGIYSLGTLQLTSIIFIFMRRNIMAKILRLGDPCYQNENISLNTLNSTSKGDLLWAEAITAFLLFYVVPFLTILLCYSYIWRQSIKHRKKIMEQRQAIQANNQQHFKELIKSTKTFALVIGVFLFTFLPHLIVLCYYVLFRITTQSYVMFISMFLAYSSAFWNPLIYACRDTKFRQAFRKILPCTIECRSCLAQ